MPTEEQKATALLKQIKQAETDLERTNHASAWSSDANLKRIKPQDRAAKKKELEARVAKLNAKYRELETNSRTHGGRRRTRRRHRTRSTRSTRALTARRR